MPRPQAREFAAITDHFNALARALETARTENLRLNRQLITAQDDERRRTALELHDEVGPCSVRVEGQCEFDRKRGGELARER